MPLSLLLLFSFILYTIHDSHLLVELLDLLDLIVASHEDTGSVVDVFGLDLEHALHVAVDSLTTGWSRVSVDYI